MLECAFSLALVVLANPESAAKPPPSAVEKLDKLPAGYKVEGSLKRGLRFEDKNGTNVMSFSERVDQNKGAVFVFATHWVEKNGKRRQLRAVKDWVADCEFDLVHGFVERAFEVTDLDGDGIKEVSFAYTLDCTSDVSPNQLKLLMLENGDKYIIRGVTRVQVGGPDELEGGQMSLDESVKKGPEVFRTHLEKKWQDIVRSDP